MAIGIEKQIPSKGEAVSLVVLTAGVMLAVWEGTVAGSVQSIVLCLAGTVCNAAMMSTTGRVLSERIDVLRLTFYTAPVSCICLLPLFYLREVIPCLLVVVSVATLEAVPVWLLHCLARAHIF